MSQTQWKNPWRDLCPWNTRCCIAGKMVASVFIPSYLFILVKLKINVVVVGMKSGVKNAYISFILLIMIENMQSQ